MKGFADKRDEDFEFPGRKEASHRARGHDIPELLRFLSPAQGHGGMGGELRHGWFVFEVVGYEEGLVDF